MKKIIFYVFLISVSFLSCVTNPVTNSGYNAGTSGTKAAPSIYSEPNISITKMDFVNYNSEKDFSSGISFFKDDIRYIAPKITYNSTGGMGEIDLNVKIIGPDGNLIMTSDSPKGYTFSYTLFVLTGENGETVKLTGIGNEKKGTYTPGIYDYEIWSNGKKLYSSSFIIRTESSPTVPSIVITKMDFVNVDKDGKIIGSPGISFESNALKFIAPRITYDSIGAEGKIILNVKIIKPDGSMIESSSTIGYTYDNTLNVQPGKKGLNYRLIGLGQEAGGFYLPGIYGYEILSNGKKLYSANFIVRSESVPTVPSIIITKMDFANLEKNKILIGSYGTSFESSLLKYLAPRITYDSIGTAGEIVLNIKIIKPDGKINVSTTSPSGYTINYTLNVQPDKKGVNETLAGWGTEKGGSYSPGTYYCEIWSKDTRLYRASFSVTNIDALVAQYSTTTPQKTDTAIVFTHNGPQGVNVRLYYNGQLIDVIDPSKKVTKTVSGNENNITLKAQIGDETKELKLSARGSTTINVNIFSRRTPSGIIITDFSIVDRIPSYSVKYVNVDGLSLRDDANANAALLEVLPQDCRVEILDEYSNDWVRIKYKGNKTGYVNDKYLTKTQPPFVITSLKVGNLGDSKWLTSAGGALYSSQMRYLGPVVTYDATYNGKITFFVKIIQPNGAIFRNASASPTGFSYSTESQVKQGNNQTLNILGWGNKDKSLYQAGEWTVEVWNNSRRLWSEKITILP
jgi:hypothetical protein